VLGRRESLDGNEHLDYGVLKRRLHQHEAAANLSYRLHETLSLQQSVSAIWDTLSETIAPDAICVYLLRDGHLEPLDETRCRSQNLSRIGTGQHWLGECLCGLAASEGEAIFVPDITSDPRCTLAECKEAGVVSFAALPLRFDDRVVGVLGLASSVRRDFGADSWFLDLLSHLFALAFHNAALIDELRREQLFIKTALDAQTDTFFLFNVKTKRAVRWNQAFVAVSGYSNQEIADLPAPDSYYGEEELKRAAAFIPDVVAYGNGVIELELTCKDGTTVPTEYQVNVVNDESGTPSFLFSIGRDISARRHAEEALQLSEDRYRAVAELTSDFAYSLHIRSPNDHSIEWVSDSIKNVTGYSLDEILASGAWMGLLHPDDKCVAHVHLQDLLANQPSTAEYRIVARNGDIHWVKDSASPRFDSVENRVVQIQGAIQDITDRVNAESALSKSESELNEIFTMSPDMICIAGLESTTFLKVNPAFTKILGIPEAELLDRSFLEFIHPDDIEITNRVVEEQLKQGEPVVSFENRYRCKDGSYRILNWVSHPDIERGITVALARDVTEVRAAQLALRDSEARFRSIVEFSPMGVHMYRLDADGQLVFVTANSAADMILGVEHSTLVGKTIEDAFPGVTATKLPEHFCRVAQSGEPWTTQQFTYKDDSVSSAFEVHAFQTEPGTMVAMFVDVFDRIEAERRRIELEVQLRQSQKLESIGTLASGVAHEVNNPLMGMINYAELIKHRSTDAAQVSQYAEEIIGEGNRIATIVRNLLAFSRQDDAQHSLARISDIVNASLSLLRSSLRKEQIALTVDLPEDLPEIRCQNQQIQQVLINLISNSRAALVERYPSYDDNKILAIRAHVHADGNQWLRVTVEDRGTGIPEELLDRIFDPFFTSKTRDQGTGLGLSVSHGIIKDHHGRISAESVCGEFTRFHFDLPLQDSSD
jgi:PAS domain S-box-containing protein